MEETNDEREEKMGSGREGKENGRRERGRWRRVGKSWRRNRGGSRKSESEEGRVGWKDD